MNALNRCTLCGMRAAAMGYDFPAELLDDPLLLFVLFVIDF